MNMRKKSILIGNICLLLVSSINCVPSKKEGIILRSGKVLSKVIQQQNTVKKELCPICMSICIIGKKTIKGRDRRNPGITTECGHHFHENCLNQWIKDHNTCPSCRHQIVNPLPLTPEQQINLNERFQIAVRLANLTDTVNLLAQGANVNFLDQFERTPLHDAISHGDINIINALLDHGASVNAQNMFGRTALHLACFRGASDPINILLDHGANIHIQDQEGKTALHLAARNGSTEIINRLLQSGANIHVQDNNGGTPLHDASFNSNLDGIDQLIAAGANIDLQDGNGQTPLHLAVMTQNRSSITKLINYGARTNIVNNRGVIAKDYALLEVISNLLT